MIQCRDFKSLLNGSEVCKVPKEKTVVAARHAKRRLENHLDEAHKFENIVAEVKRQRKIQRTEDEKSERVRANAERRTVAGAEDVYAEASRLSSRRKSHPVTVE